MKYWRVAAEELRWQSSSLSIEKLEEKTTKFLYMSNRQDNQYVHTWKSNPS